MKGARIHLDLCRVFADLARTGNFSMTAEKHYLTQSAISQQLAFLERHFGKKLINRGRGSFALTEAGAIFLEACLKMTSTYQEAVRAIRHPGELTGTVRVETVYSIGLYSLASYVKTFLKRYPRVDLHIEYNRSDRIYENVMQDVCTLGIVAYPWRHKSILLTPFQDERLVVVCPPEHPLAGRRQVRPADLHKRDFVAFDQSIPTGKAVDELLRRRGVVVNVVQEFDNIETLKRSVEVGAGLSLLPENAVVSELERGSLIALPFAKESFLRPLSILSHAGRPLPRAAEEFVRWLTRPQQDEKIPVAASRTG